MKRLLTVIGVMAALLCIPDSTWAEEWGELYLLNNVASGQYWSKSERNATYKFTKQDDNIYVYTLDASSVTGDIYWRISTPDKNDANYDIYPSEGSVVVGTSGYNAQYDEKNDNRSFKISHSINTYTTYKITATYHQDGGGYWNVKVESSGSKTPTEQTELTLRSNIYDKWNTGNSYDSGSFSDTGIYTWIIPVTDIQNAGIASGDAVQFKLELNGTWYGNGKEVGETWSSVTGGGTDDNCTFIYDDDATSYSVQAKYEGTSWQVRVIAVVDGHDYYWVSPQVTNNQKWPSFKLVASRNRTRDGNGKVGDGKTSTRYWSFTIKDDDLADYKTKEELGKDKDVEWYIVRDDNKRYYMPTTDTEDTSGSYGTSGSYIQYNTHDGVSRTTNEGMGKFKFKKGLGNSYTFILNSSKGNVSFDYAAKNAEYQAKYYLIGNFSSATSVNDITESRDMTPIYYKGSATSVTDGIKGLVVDASTESPDSVVYVVTVNRPTDGWGALYLDVSPKDADTGWGWGDYAGAGEVFRPLISINNNLDGRALTGGLWEMNYNQSINPEPSDYYTSYTFRFNATTMTYRLEFHTSLYLVGPAVSTTENNEGSWDLSNVASSDPSTKSDPRIKLEATQETGHYRNRVYFTKGKQFRFVKNEDEGTANYLNTWMENANEPRWNNPETGKGYSVGGETQYRNVLEQQNGTGSALNTEPSGTSVTFDLPSGWYYINFYENDGTNAAYYTIEKQIELRDYANVYYRNASGTIDETRNVVGRGDYNFFTTWSDHIAWAKPDDIDVFTVSSFGYDESKKAGVAVLTKQSGKYIPANRGVILASKRTKDNLSGGLAYSEPASTTKLGTVTIDLNTCDAADNESVTGNSLLLPLYDETDLKRYSEQNGTGNVTKEGNYANYLFGFYRHNKVTWTNDAPDNQFDLGFWLTLGGTTYPNDAFLQITKDDAQKMGVGVSYDLSSIGATSAPCFYLIFEEPQSDIITAISDLQHNNSAKGNAPASANGWYTLQGVRIDAPSGHGIFIHNGKKVIK